jgi:asparagine synthase (glutamine-hydrolysing)
MSIIFGVCKPPHAIVTREELLHFAESTERYAPDGMSVGANGRIGMGFQPYYTHARSHLESQPLVDVEGNMLTLDGRIDNQAELRDILDIRDNDCPDSIVVLAAFRRWGKECFSQLIGDWALALWSSREQEVYLARDHAGARSLYFANVHGTLLWSTYLETFFTNGHAYSLDEEYAACYLNSQPIRTLTPYKGIEAIPPAQYLIFNGDGFRAHRHWHVTDKEKLHYSTLDQYEEHFLALFQQSIKRRTGPGSPILAQLSGGMDSTSIVCMSDFLRRAANPPSELLDTISFYNDTDSNWNERPYFSLVETRRGKAGIHVRTSGHSRTFQPADPSFGNYLLPGADSGSAARERESCSLIEGGGYRVMLSGIGGDELLGGVPTPFPELADYLVSLRLKSFFKQSLSWCLARRQPMIEMLAEAVRFTVGLYRPPQVDKAKLSPWASTHLRKRYVHAGIPHGSKTNRWNVPPSAICSDATWWFVMETLPHMLPGLVARYECRYPYLDRDLVDFLVRVPREHLVHPERRRFLMRKALRNLVPMEILERRRKAFLARSPLLSLEDAQKKVAMLFADSLTAAYGLIDPACFDAFYKATLRDNNLQWVIPLFKTIDFELWLRSRSGIPGMSCPLLSNEFAPN